MQKTDMPHDHSQSPKAERLHKVSRLVFFCFLAIAAFFLITEHRAHLYGWWPLLLLAACPLLHRFHHGGHGRSEEGPVPGSTPRSGPPSTAGGQGHPH